MELNEAIENTKNRIKSWENIAETGKCCLSNEEYESSQKVCDEENMIIQELERLQKENEELKNIDLTTVYLKGVADEKERWRNNIRDLILKIDVDIERNKKREIMYKEEMGTSEYVCKMIAYTPETVKIILQNLLKEE